MTKVWEKERERSERNWKLYEGRGRKSDRISEENRNKSWSSNTEKTKEANSLANMGVTSRTEPIVDYQERQNTSKKNHKKNNVTPKTDTTVIIYNEITKEVYIDKLERVRLNSYSNHNADESNIHVAKLKL